MQISGVTGVELVGSIDNFEYLWSLVLLIGAKNCEMLMFYRLISQDQLYTYSSRVGRPRKFLEF